MEKYRNYIPPYQAPTLTPIKFPTNLQPINTDINEDAQPDGKTWGVIDKIFGYGQGAADIWTQIKTGEKPYQYGYDNPNLQWGESEKGLFGIRRPWGGVLVLSVLGITGIAIYKMSKK